MSLSSIFRAEIASALKRNTNVEILRIVAMFMVLIVHVDFWALSSPTPAECADYPLESFARIAFEMFAIVGVNIFVLISGWFSITFRWRGLAKFLYQCFFIMSVMYAVGVWFGYVDLNFETAKECLALSGPGWFIKTYLLLFLLAPVLNAFVETASRTRFAQVLICLFAVQFVYGFLTDTVVSINNGYSLYSFIGLYLLARYVRLYAPQSFWRKGLLLWSSCFVLMTLLYWLTSTGISDEAVRTELKGMQTAYDNPLMILGALGLVMWAASYRPRHSVYVNMVSTSCLAVYLCHNCNRWTAMEYMRVARKCYLENSGLEYLATILLYMFAVYLFSIALDFVRRGTQCLLQAIREED